MYILTIFVYTLFSKTLLHASNWKNHSYYGIGKTSQGNLLKLFAIMNNEIEPTQILQIINIINHLLLLLVLLLYFKINISLG